jgi:hypothetical protein
VTQRGNGRARTFFDDDDYALYRDLLAEHCRAAEVAVWAWCLMPNHVHLILVPADADGLRRALAAAMRYVSLNPVRARKKGTPPFSATVCYASRHAPPRPRRLRRPAASRYPRWKKGTLPFSATVCYGPQGRPLSTLRRSTLNSSLSSPSASQADQSVTAVRRSRQMRSAVNTESARCPQWAAALDQA